MINAKYGDCGIYKITCTGNNKVYIGQSVDLRERGQEHFRHLRNDKHNNRYMQSSFNKYGIDSFKFEVLEECGRSELYIRECFWMEFYESYIKCNGFNIDIPDIERMSFSVSQDTKKLLRDINIIYTEDELIEFLLKYYKENRKVPRIKDLEGNPLYPSPRTYKKRFKTFNNALKKAGLIDKIEDKTRLNRRLRYSKDDLIEMIRNYVRKHDKYPYAKDFDTSDLLPSRDAIKRVFGNVTEAMHESGYLDYEINKKYYTKKETFELLKGFIKENGRFPLLTEMKVSNGLVGTNIVQKKFGGIRKLKEEYAIYILNEDEDELDDIF